MLMSLNGLHVESPPFLLDPDGPSLGDSCNTYSDEFIEMFVDKRLSWFDGGSFPKELLLLYDMYILKQNDVEMMLRIYDFACGGVGTTGVVQLILFFLTSVLMFLQLIASKLVA